MAAAAAPATGLGAEEATTRAKASIPDGTVRLLTAPHVGGTVCVIPDGTALTFIRHARHGPHRFAEVRVLEGMCEGKDGYIPARAVDKPS